MLKCVFKKIAIISLFVLLSGCVGKQCLLTKESKLQEKGAYAATTIPVNRLEIKMIDNQKKIVRKNASLKSTSKESSKLNYLAETLYFGDGSAFLNTSDDAKVRKIARLVKDKNAMISIYGYASSRTKDTDAATHKMINFSISEQRANAVANTLMHYGVEADKINIEALADSKPVYLEVMPKGESLNRRVEIFVAY